MVKVLTIMMGFWDCYYFGLH